MLKVELREVKEVNGRRQEREVSKRKILKDRPLILTEEVVKWLRNSEKGSSGRKKATNKTKGKHCKKRLESREEETESSTDDSSDILEPQDPQVFECIEVAERES